MSARDFALLAEEAYSAKPDIGIADSASRAILRHTPAGLVVAFTGTDNLACLGADFDVRTVSVPGVGPIHRGFWGAWKAIQGAVESAIGSQAPILVGHSLGAAIAICAAVSLSLGGRRPAAVYGFEPPRVSPEMGVRTLLASVPVWLCKNGNDAVPDVPPDWQHAALLHHVGRPSLPLPNLEDHAIARVISALSPPSQAPSLSSR